MPRKGVCGRGKFLALLYYSHRGLCASMGDCGGANFLLHLITASPQCLHLSEHFFIDHYDSSQKYYELTEMLNNIRSLTQEYKARVNIGNTYTMMLLIGM